MAVYWVLCRLSPVPSADGRSFEQRSEAFQAIFSDLTERVWAEVPGFAVFRATASIEVVAALFKKAIDPASDMFLIHEIDGPDAVICGAYADADILKFMPHLRGMV